MPRPLTREQILENTAFLKALRLVGNVREAARLIGAHRAKFTKRRAAHPAFATQWDAALAFAHAALGPVQKQPPGAATEPRVIRTRSGKLQLRRLPAGRLTRDGEQAFLAALSATANVRLAAAAAGFSHSAFYAHRRKNPAFAREMQAALEIGYDRLEQALIQTGAPTSGLHDAWRHNDPPPIPPMSPAQALQLLYLHQKQARLEAEPPHIKRRRGESREAHSFRLAAMYRAAQQREREAFAMAEAARHRRGERSRHEPPAPLLPDLAQVTGWSKADPAKVPRHADVALFGGWRLEDLEGRGE